jgi:fatty-acyl-CoA synthase
VTPLSHVAADTSDSVRDTTVASILEAAAAASPGRDALVEGIASDRRRWTYAQLLSEATAVGGALAARFDPGDRLAVFGPSIPEVLILSYGAAMAGLVLVPFNPALRAREARHILSSSGAAGVFVVDAYRDNRPGDIVGSLSLPALREILRFEEWSTFTASGQAAPGRPGPAPDDIAQIIFTSGTTGAPKCARISHRGMTNAARFGAERFGLAPGDVYVNNMPLFHVGGQEVAFGICQAQATDVSVVAFDPGVVLGLFEEERATHTVAVPTLLVGMIDHPSFGSCDLSSLRSISSGGAVVPPELIRYIEATLAARMTVVFGQTESCGYISQTELDDEAELKAVTLGHPLPQIEARVVDPASGSIVPLGEVGELQVRGFNVMRGYHDLPEATAETIVDGGWLRTGDLVTMDERGYLRIAGRLKEMIVSGALNIFPLEIESVLVGHPGVALAAVLGVPDRRWGEQVVAVLQPAAGGSIDVAAVEAWARERLAPYKIPKRWVVVDEMPLTATGKVQKFVLREGLG